MAFLAEAPVQCAWAGRAHGGSGRSLCMGIGSWPVFLSTSHCVLISGKLMDCGWDGQIDGCMITEKSMWVAKENTQGVNCWVGGQLDEGVLERRDIEMP